MESPQPGRHHHDGGVGGRCHLDLHLADADGLDDDHGQSGRAEHAHGVGDGQGQSPEVPAGRHGADEHRRIERMLLHADPVAQDRPPLKGDVGSMASTPTWGSARAPGSGQPDRASVMRRSVRVDLPAPGAPVSPTV
jgi:hypothetical protein